MHLQVTTYDGIVVIIGLEKDKIKYFILILLFYKKLIINNYTED